VIGGGVVGLCVARELALRGATVRLIDRGGREGADRAAATTASLGVLSSPRGGRTPLARLSALARAAYPAFAAALLAETGLDPGYRAPGSLHVVPSPPRPAARAKLESAYRAAGVEARWIEGEELRRLAPIVRAEIPLGLHIPGEAVVDPAALARSLRASLAGLGVEIRDAGAGARLRLEPEPWVEVPGEDPIAGSTVVVAAGAWTPEVVGPSAAPAVPIHGVRGQAIEVRSSWDEGPSLRFPSGRFGRDYHIVARGNGTAWVGSTVEDVGLDARVTPEGVAELLAASSEVLSRPIGEGDIVRAWAGLRPRAMRPGGPFLGRIPGSDRAWVAAGHYRSGMLLGPISARFLVHAILGDEDALRREGFDPGSLAAFAPRSTLE
jgi:glycine oxidase